MAAMLAFGFMDLWALSTGSIFLSVHTPITLAEQTSGFLAFVGAILLIIAICVPLSSILTLREVRYIDDEVVDVDWGERRRALAISIMMFIPSYSASFLILQLGWWPDAGRFGGAWFIMPLIPVLLGFLVWTLRSLNSGELLEHRYQRDPAGATYSALITPAIYGFFTCVLALFVGMFGLIILVLYLYDIWKNLQAIRMLAEQRGQLYA
jgi:hypothetical protein